MVDSPIAIHAVQLSVVRPQVSNSYDAMTYHYGSVLDTTSMRVRFAAAKCARVAGYAQVAAAEVDATTGFERKAVDRRDIFDGKWVGNGQEWQKGENGEVFGKLHIERKIRVLVKYCC